MSHYFKNLRGIQSINSIYYIWNKYGINRIRFIRVHADSSDDEMDAAGDCEALFVAGASDHRGDASSFIRNMRIRLSVGKAAKWSEEEKI
jgi:hypothetical protein